MTKQQTAPLSEVASAVRYIPLDHLILSDANVRKTYRKEGFDELAASIAAHGLLQNLTVRAERDLEGNETGRFEIFAGGRRFSALTRLARQKKIARNTLIPCVVREDGVAEELSLVENVVRENLHPADQFEAFKDLNDNKGLGAEEIAARFGVSGRTVKERLRLASVSPVLLKLYRQGEMTLDQVMAFTVSDNHARQEEVWETLGYDQSPDAIRRMLTTTHIASDDPRARFVGREAYEAAGGVIFRDLFAEDDGGYFVNPPLLEKLAIEKLETIAATVASEGWKWTEAVLSFPHGHGMRRLYPHDVELSDADRDRLEVIEDELDQIDGAMEAGECDEATIERYNGLVAEYEALNAKGRVFDPEQLTIAGAFVTIGSNGEADIVRGLVKPEDDEAVEEEAHEPVVSEPVSAKNALSAALIADLTAQRTMALRAALGGNTEIALWALTYDLVQQTFRCGSASCLSLSVRSPGLEGFAKGIDQSIAARQIEERHSAWAAQLPDETKALWAFICALSGDKLLALIAHCVGLTVDIVQRPHETTTRFATVDRMAEALALDMRRYWTPTVASYFGRVSKPLILEAVTEAVSAEAAKRIENAKKAEMATAAETLLADTMWLPVLLRPSSATGATAAKAAD